MSHDHHQHHHHGAMSNGADATTAASPAPGHDHAAGHHLMRMWFHGGAEEVILFDCWRTETFGGLALSCLLVFLMAAGYEALKWFRVYFELLTTSAGNGSLAAKGTVSISLKGLTGRHGAEDALIEKSGGGAESPPPQEPEAAIQRQQSSDQVYAPTVVVSDPSAAARRKSFPLPRPPKCQWLVDWLRGGGHSAFAPCRLLETALYCLQLTIAYWLMLIAMTYNVYLTAAVVLGAGFGHWLFAGMKCVHTPTPASMRTLDQADNFASDACH